MLHGALIGIVATAMYLVLVFAKPGGFAAAVATQGVPPFWFSQAMRIAGCVPGAARNPRIKREIAFWPADEVFRDVVQNSLPPPPSGSPFSSWHSCTGRSVGRLRRNPKWCRHGDENRNRRISLTVRVCTRPVCKKSPCSASCSSITSLFRISRTKCAMRCC